MPVDYRAKLKNMAGQWSGAVTAAKERQGSNVPDGKYRSVCYSAKLKEQNDGKLTVVWRFAIVEGENEGDKVQMRNYLETAENLSYLASDLARFDVDISQLDLPTDLEPALELIEGEGYICSITLKTSGQYQNVFINRVEEERYEGDLDELQDPVKEAEKPKAAAATGRGTGRAGKAAAAPTETVAEEPKRGRGRPAAAKPEPEPVKPSEPDEEEVIEDETEEEVIDEELKVGDKVEWVSKGETKQGIVQKIEEAEGKIIVKKPDGVAVRIGVDTCVIIDSANDK